jgi:DNA-binding HxlR family transcriptional regulator
VEKKEALFCAQDAAMQDGMLTQGRLAKLAAAMGPNGVERDDPTRSVMAMLGDRWSPLILLVLETGAWRHADLRRVTAQLSSEKALSQRVMTLKLRALEADGFVSRQVTTDVPPKVSYALTPLGQELVAQLQRMIDWLDAHRAVIHAARAAFAG